MLKFLSLISFLVVGIQSDNSCRYEYPTRGVIDLSSIGKLDGSARFKDLAISTASSHLFSFNPCYSFSEDSCKNVAACRITKDRTNYDVLGIQGQSSWTFDSSGNAMLVYNQTTTTLSITMLCSSNNEDELLLMGEGPINRFQMILRSPCACWDGCRSSRPTSIATSTSVVTSTRTIQSDSCRYYDSELGVIDLSQVGKRKGKAAFKNVHEDKHSTIVWSYNPCFSFSQKKCENVAACRMDTEAETSMPVALQTMTTWVDMESNDETKIPTIVYSNSMIGQKRLNVQLICDNSTSEHHLEVVGESGQNEYLMKLTSPCACWNGCNSDEKLFRWKPWMIVASGGMLLILALACMLGCSFCCRSQRKRRRYIINEDSPIYEKS